jgi:hypothetical protein
LAIQLNEVVVHVDLALQHCVHALLHGTALQVRDSDFVDLPSAVCTGVTL